MAVTAASLCASAKQIDLLFAVNLFTCVFACQAQRALATARMRMGWIRKARRAGQARVKARRQPGPQRGRMQSVDCSHVPVLTSQLGMCGIRVPGKHRSRATSQERVVDLSQT